MIFAKRFLSAAAAAALCAAGASAAADETAPEKEFRQFPPPSTVSAAAAARLSAPLYIAEMTHAPGSAEEWKALATMYDGQTAKAVDAMIETLPVRVEESEMAGVAVRIVTPKNLLKDKSGKVLINLHGGAYVINGGKAGLREALSMASKGGYRVIAVDYRMPPDHPFPAALDDAIAVYETLLASYDAKDIGVFGLSAGGGLAAAMVLAARDRGLPMPAAVGLNTPWSDLDEIGDTYATLEGLDPSLVTYDGFLRSAAMLYANGEDMKNPLLSPVYGNFEKGFPPSFLISGTRDMFLSNTVRLHRALRDAGRSSDLVVFEGMWHAFSGVPEEDVALAEMAAFFDRHLIGKHNDD
ncbi:MAG: alpha/beta hydrolase [Pseudomonadota bacterium]